MGSGRATRQDRRRAGTGHRGSTDRGQGRVVVVDHRDRRARRRPGRRAGGRACRGGSPAEVVLVSSGAIAAGLAPLGLSRRPRDLATQQAAASVGQGLLMRALQRRVRAARRGRAGPADRRRRDPAGALPQCLPDAAPAARPAGHPDRQRERHRRHRGDPVRRQRPAGGAGRPPGHADLLVLLSDVDGLYDRGPGSPGSARGRPRSARRPTSPASTSAAPARPGVGTGGMVTKVEAAADRHRRRHPRGADLRAGRARP